MIRRFAVASLLTLASAAGLSSASFAQTVNFNANNPPVCTVNSGAPVTLTGNGQPLVTSLSGNGSVTAQCNSLGNVASSIAQLSGPNVDEQNTTAINLTVPGTGALTTIPVSMTATPEGNDTVIPAATNYAFAITVTVTP